MNKLRGKERMVSGDELLLASRQLLCPKTTLAPHRQEFLLGIVERLCLFEGHLALSFQFGKNLHGRLILSAGFWSLKGVGGVKVSSRDAKNCQPGCRQSMLTRIALENRFPQHFSLAETTQGIIAPPQAGID